MKKSFQIKGGKFELSPELPPEYTITGHELKRAQNYKDAANELYWKCKRQEKLIRRLLYFADHYALAMGISTADLIRGERSSRYKK